MVATGAAAYHFGNKCDMEQVSRQVPPTALTMGNLDPVSLFKSATPDEMRRATTDLLRKMSNYPNFVISSGCDTRRTLRLPTSTPSLRPSASGTASCKRRFCQLSRGLAA